MKILDPIMLVTKVRLMMPFKFTYLTIHGRFFSVYKFLTNFFRILSSEQYSVRLGP